MKKLILLAVLFVNSVAIAQLKNLSLETLSGTYTATHPEMPVKNIITINIHGDVTLVEESPMGKLECSGRAKLEGSLLKSSVTCANGAKFDQQINLSKVENLNRFKAPVLSSLYGAEFELDFVKTSRE
jgi:hypothetical protein